MPILGGDGWVGDALKNGREALNNTFISNHYSGDNPDPIVQNFVSTYRARYNREPDAIAALAAADIAGVTGRLKMNAQRNVDKPAVIQEVTYANGEVKFVYKATINPG